MRKTASFRGRPLVAIPFVAGLLAAGVVAITLHLAHGSAESTLPPDKAARLDALAAQAQRDHSLPAPSLPPRYPDKPRPVGILEGVPAPLDPHLYTIANMWQQMVGDRYEMVYAGVLTADPAQGVLIVMTAPVDMLNPPSGAWSGPDVHLTPTRDGGVRLTTFTGSVLSLQATDGTLFRFDASTRTYAG